MATSSGPAAPSGARTQILFLGTAGGPPLRFDRSEPSTLLTVSGREYLIDCGIGTARRLVEAGAPLPLIKTIFFTHLHADHDMGLADLMASDLFSRGPEGAADPINIYGPPQTKELVDSAFRFVIVGIRPFAAANPFQYRSRGGVLVSPFVSHEIAHDERFFADGRVRVTAAENSHYVLIPARERPRFKSYSYRFETPDGVIVFSGDTGPSGSIGTIAKGADVLIAEASYRDPEELDQSMAQRAARNHLTAEQIGSFRHHFTAEHLDAAEIGQLASRAGVKSVILYHYDPANKADQAAYVSDVKKYFAGPVFAPDDLDRFCLSSGVVAACGTARRR
jgi:ribonuclease BN (tRNA processing enzyme)